MKFDMSEAWREATAMIAANREVLLIVAGIFFFLPNLVWALVTPDFQGLVMGDPEQAQDAMMAFYTDYWWLMGLVVIASIAGYLALLTLLRDHARPTVAQAMRSGAAGLLPAIATYLLVWISALVVMVALVAIGAASGNGLVGFVLLLIGIAVVVYAAIKSSLAAPVIALERVYNPFRVLARSWRLTKGNILRLVLFFVLIAIVYIVVSMVLGMIVTGLALILGETAFTIIGALFSALIAATVAVVLVAVLASAHRQLSGASPERLGETFE